MKKYLFIFMFALALPFCAGQASALDFHLQPRTDAEQAAELTELGQTCQGMSYTCDFDFYLAHDVDSPESLLAICGFFQRICKQGVSCEVTLTPAFAFCWPILGALAAENQNIANQQQQK